ncbi:MAG: hypothetical protein M5R36_23050 [Deltaproteobacteria bacterium]|nr:hypothetical protein [Deltaproteobacteria bacterium]
MAVGVHQVHPIRERLIEAFLVFCGFVSVLTTFGIVGVLAYESFEVLP